MHCVGIATGHDNQIKALKKNNENQTANTQGLFQQKHIQQLSLKVLVPRQTWKELGGHTNRKILKGAAFITLLSIISLPTRRGRKDRVTKQTMTEIQRTLLQVFSYPNSLLLG